MQSQVSRWKALRRPVSRTSSVRPPDAVSPDAVSPDSVPPDPRGADPPAPTGSTMPAHAALDPIGARAGTGWAGVPTTLRAGVAVFMLAGFYALAVGILVALAAVTAWAWVVHPGGIAVKLTIVALALTSGIGLALLRAVPGHPDGVPVVPDRAPDRWRTVRELAGTARTAPPDEILVVADANAAVSEDARLLGLVGGRAIGIRERWTGENLTEDSPDLLMRLVCKVPARS